MNEPETQNFILFNRAITVKGWNCEQFHAGRGVQEFWRVRQVAGGVVFADFWPYSAARTVYCPASKHREGADSYERAVEIISETFAYLDRQDGKTATPPAAGPFCDLRI